MLVIPILLGAAAMPNYLAIAFGSQYSSIGLILVDLTLFRVVNLQPYQIKTTISGLDQTNINTRTGLVLNVGIGYALLLEYGILGAVVAMII